MGVDMKVKAIYDSEIGNITRSEKNWKDVLKVAGQLYRYEFDNIVMVTAQRPPEKSTLMADYDTWKKVGRYVKRGAKGCAIFPSRALNPRMRYIFDISDTGGKNVKLTGDLEGENLKDYVDFLVSEGQIEQYDNSNRESLKNTLKQFTGTDVWLIIKEEFGDRMTELMQLSGSVIKEESKKRNGLQQEMDMEQLVYASVMYAVGTRCGFDLSVQEQDFSQIVNIKDEEIIYRLGSIVCDVSCSVLREFSRNLKAIESERRIGYVRRNDLQGSGRTALSADRDAGRDGGSHEAGQIRKDGDELSKGERAGKIQDADEIREDVREDVSGRGGSEPAVRPAGDAVSGEAQATESVIDNGDVEDKRAGEDAGRGSGTPSDSDAIPLESDDTELNRELDEINSLGVSKEAEYTQASFFFDQNGQASIGTIHTEDENNNQFMRQFEQDRKAALAGKYNYLNPKKSATVPGEYIKQVLMRGTGFVGGKGRVCKIFETEIDAGTRAKRIKAEYGQGGAGWPVDGLGLHGYDTFHGNGLRFQWRDEDGEVEGYVSWKDIEKELGVLILTGEYQPETPRIDELAMDGLREDDEVIDAEYREVEPEEAESEIDDYAIPDEPESYASNRDYVSAKGMTPQEAADEDRMVTQAEYGAEIEAETSEKDPSELQYITPIDYAKRIAELDEDLRDAAEILVTDCSCYTPFRAFLMDVVQSDFAFMPNKLDLIRDIALGTDNAERKAYSNNKYGLVEYSIRSGYVKISYKNRNGVRKEGALDWRELYEILSYMVKQPFYCGEDQKKYYQETKQKADRDKMNPVYKRFFDIEDSVKANRLETRERAIANGWETKIDENGHVVSDDAVSVSVDDIQADTESQETVDFTPKQEPVQQVESLENEKNVDRQTKHNFHYNLWEMEKGGAKTRYQWNMDAIRTLKQIESENRIATPEEQKVLSKFVGWGGLSQAFDEENAGWSKEYKELKEMLSDEEYAAARATVNNAFYTSPEIAMCINSALVQFGFRGGNVLEPSMGIGNFFGSMPAPMQRSNLYGVELDSISGRIAKQLYPEDNIQIKGFEKTTFKNNSFDVVIGNIPFGDYGIADKSYDKYHFKIHDYFAAKAVDKVKPGGIVAIVTSKFTMDKKNDKARKYLAERCDLLGAVRLPSGTFKDADSVTTDIIFLKKRTTMTSVIPDWVHVSETANGIPCNQYFVDNPDMVLGTMAWDERMRGKYGADSKVTTCYANSDTPLAQQLINAISKIDGVIDTVETELDNGTAEILPADPTVRNFTHTIVDGDLYFRENEVMVKVTETGKSLERMKGLHTLRQATMELINAQADGCTDEQLAELQKKLNSTYDNFRTKFGNITDSANSRCFSNDDDYNTLAALEVVNVENKTVEKAAIFTKRTILPDIPVSKVDTALEALQVSMDRLGKVDIIYMSQLTDTTPEKVIADLGNEIFRDPAKVKDNDPYSGYTESSEYLSGNIRDKLRIARDHAEHIDSSYNKNVEALMKVVPKDLEASEISVRIGANWIDVADYNNFLNEYAHANTYYYPVTRTKLGEYKIEGKTSDRSVAATETFGTSRMNSYQIFENLLNQRDILVRDRREEGDKVWYEINTKETQIAKEKARLMKEAFRTWLWEDMGRREKYVAKYNYLFNSIRGREYDGSHQTFPGMNTSITLRKHQSNAIMRAKLGGNTLFAHEVGAGKSFEMVATVMEKKRLGLINKACVVVPKHLTLQMASEWLRLYPNAKLLVAKPEDFTKANRKRFIARCVTGDYDAVIMSFTQFERIPMSDEYKEQFMQKELHDIMSAISEAGRKDKSSVKALERQKKNIEERLEKLLSSPKDSSLCFEKLGFDYLVCDEAHNYKNCFVSTKMSNVAGVQTTAAQKSEDMLMKTQYLNNKYGCNNILFATGTPISNSMVEFYVMQRYLRPDLLEKAGLQNFDDWASTFGEVVSQLEIKPAGNGFQMKNRFSKFVNIPELMQMYKEFADIQTADMLKLPVPKIETGKPIVVTSKPDERQKAYMKELATRSETIHSGTVDPRQDNMLKITHEARLLGLDTRCIFKDAQPAPDSKVMKLIDNLEKNYRKTMAEKGVQIVFCDIAINEDETHFSVYKAIKQALMERGIPEKEICFAGDAKTDKARDEMFKSLRKGEKRFIIASTSKLGTGANIQDRICAIHHLDIPWKPSDLTQQDGRGIRQGNRFSQVGIYHYLTEETFDAYMMGIITNKAKFINQILTSKSPARVSEDVDEMVLTYSEMQAIASGNPMIKEKIQLDNDVAMLKTLEAEHKKSIYKMQELAEKILPKQITHYSELLAKARNDMSKYQEHQALNKEFEMTIGGVRYDKRENAGEQIAVAMAKCTATGEPIELGTYHGFKVTIERNPSANTFFELDNKPCIAVLHGELTYSCDIATDNGVGNVRRIENLAGIQINQKQCSFEEQLERANKDLSEAQQNMLKPFEHGQELAEKTKRLEYVNAQLSGNSQSINNAHESAVEFRFHNNKYQALIGTKNKSEWCDVVSKGGKLIAASDTKVYNLSEKESDQFRSYVFNGDKIDTGKNNSLLEKLKPKALKL